MNYVIGTRGSKLAMTQAELVRERLQTAYPEDSFEIKVVRTRGDKIQDRPLNQVGDSGVFVREIEQKLQSGEIHIGVHSMKDMPAKPAEGLIFVKAWEREDARDVLVLREATALDELPSGAVIATGSIRRELQLKQLRPDIQVVGIRGNVDTRLAKMEEMKLDGLVLAAAGLHRLGIRHRISCYLEPQQMIPAPAQGVLALEIKEGDAPLREKLESLSDEYSAQTAEAERLFLQGTFADCHMPVGAYCEKRDDGSFHLLALYGDAAGKTLCRADVVAQSGSEAAKKALRQIRHKAAGTVYLVGGGPGDAGLITCRGLQVLREADCVIYDRLVSPDLLSETKSGCKCIYVGKENHHHTMQQEEINELLVRKAMEYKTVVRLKGGDAYLFGRGGEEALWLYENSIAFEMIPGISSALAGPAYAGIPVTHRGIAAGVHIVTAHNQKDELADIDFEGMARGKETCVFLMGLGRLRQIAEGLMAEGMSSHMPAAVISSATTPEQKICTAPLCEIAAKTEREGLVSPALIVVGEVVKLRDKLQYGSQGRLGGKYFLVPEICHGASGLAMVLQHEGAQAEVLTLGKIRQKDVVLDRKELEAVDWMIFTSRNAVNGFWENLFHQGLDSRSLAKCRIACVGEKTKQALLHFGVQADFMPSHSNSESLAAQLLESVQAEDNVWYIKNEGAGNELRKKMEKQCCFREIPIYVNELVLPETCPIEPKLYDGIFFTCASLVSRFAALCGREWEKWCSKDSGCPIYSIGPATTECLTQHGVMRTQIFESRHASYEALAETAKGAVVYGEEYL